MPPEALFRFVSLHQRLTIPKMMELTIVPIWPDVFVASVLSDVFSLPTPPDVSAVSIRPNVFARGDVFLLNVGALGKKSCTKGLAFLM